MKLNFTWTWQHVTTFGVLVAAGMVLVVTGKVEWQALVTFALGVLFRNPMYLTKGDDDGKTIPAPPPVDGVRR